MNCSNLDSEIVDGRSLYMVSHDGRKPAASNLEHNEIKSI